MSSLELRDVCPRDGLQDLRQDVPTDVKVDLVRRLHDAGLRSIEMTSFVSARVVPQLADAAALCAALPAMALPGTLRSAFVANQDGLSRAVDAQVDEISTTVPATDGMTQANFRCDRDAMLRQVLAMRRSLPNRITASVTIAVAFGCPYDGEVKAKDILILADELAAGGYTRILLGDTVGVANPDQVTGLYHALHERLGQVVLGAHFHDPRGAGIANVVAAVHNGATLVDTALGGLGGCPFAPGAAGNVATEDVAWLLHDMGFEIGADPAAVTNAARWLGAALGVSVRSRTPTAKRFDWESRGEVAIISREAASA